VLARNGSNKLPGVSRPESDLQNELRLSEERFRQLVEQAPEAIVVSDVTLKRISDANRKALELFGCSKEELIQGGPQRFYTPAQPDSAEIGTSMHEHNVRALRGEEVVFERIVRSKSGKVTHCEVRLSLLPSREGNLLRASFIDITHRVQAERAIRAAKEAAEAAHRMKSEFLDIAAHELKNPIYSLLLLLESAQGEAKNGLKPNLKNLDRAMRQAHRLNALVKDLVDVSRLERGGPELRPVVLDLNPLISEALEEHQRIHPQQGFKWTQAPGTILVKADPLRLLQVLSNLLDNAVKYAGTGGPIEMKATLSADTVRVEVKDHGPGISEADQAKLFEPFVRGESTYGRTGFGLGLHICRRIIDLHHGHLKASSTLGNGSTFYFDLPLQAAAAPVRSEVL
jgi:two-component system sensor histidine kinase/response regulator